MNNISFEENVKTEITLKEPSMMSLPEISPSSQTILVADTTMCFSKAIYYGLKIFVILRGSNFVFVKMNCVREIINI